MTHTIVGLEPVPASGPGALAGFDAICSCGTRITSSLETLAREWGRDHAAYYNRKEAAAITLCGDCNDWTGPRSAFAAHALECTPDPDEVRLSNLDWADYMDAIRD